MRKCMALLLVLAAAGCTTLQRLERPPAYLRTLEAARAVLARHYGPAYVDKAHGMVEASPIVRASVFTKYRTRAVATVYPAGQGQYAVQMRVTNELEISEPSLLGGGQPPYDWRAVGFDRLAEASLMAEVMSELSGPRPPTPPRSSRGHSTPPQHNVLRPSVPEAPAAKPEALPNPTNTPSEEPRNAQLFDRYLAMGDLNLQRRQFDKALLEYQRATVACPKNAAGHLSLAGVWTALRRYSAGAAALRDAAAVADGQAMANTELNRLRGPAEELSQRLLLLKGWCKQKPDDSDARLLLAYHCFLAGRADEARAALGEIAKLTPKDPAARYLGAQMAAVRS